MKSALALAVIGVACTAPVQPLPRCAADVVAALADSDPLAAAVAQRVSEKACERAPADAVARRQAVTDSLAELSEQRLVLTDEQRSVVVRVLMREADAHTLRALVRFLDDRDLGAVTLAEFVNGTHPAIDDVLIERLREFWRPPDALFAALGARRARNAVEALLGFAEGGAPAAAARHALAQIGDRRAEAVLRAARDDGLDGADADWRLYCERRSSP